MKLIISKADTRPEQGFEFAERKGRGHPDTLSDGLAEYLSAKYSKYTLKRFGAILHHNFDKAGLLGGSSSVEFGHGKLIDPIRVLLNGRASISFAGEDIGTKELLIGWAKEFLKRELPLIEPERDLEFLYNLSSQSSPGKTAENDPAKSARQFWFRPRGLNDIPELQSLVANDTSLGVGYAPYSLLERLVLSIEGHFNSDQYRTENPWIGSDIKIMAFREGTQFEVTLCIPQIADAVPSVNNYYANLNKARSEILSKAQELDVEELAVYVNTRDSEERGEFYLTAIGSSIESGDEGLVGRGNRINGVISPFRPMSMEGAAGKNPVYHAGKLYYVAAQEIASKIYEVFSVSNSVSIVSQSGRSLTDPWIVAVSVPEEFRRHAELEALITEEIKNIPRITERIIGLWQPIY